MKAISYILISSAIILGSCSKKSPEEYGTEYCKCMEDNNGNLTKCKHILEEAKEVYGTDNQEAKIEFKSAAKGCLNED